MDHSRRGFLRAATFGPFAIALWLDGGTPAGATEVAEAGPADCTLPDPPPARRFVPSETKALDRISAAAMAEPANADKLRSFRLAVGRVQSRPPSDVISWTKQVAQHCIHCASSNVHNIHYDWFFLPWHRAYLYFLERILQSAASDPSLRLPYWDWENPKSRYLPEIYAPKDQPLYWLNRGDLQGPNWPLSDRKVDVQPVLRIPSFRLFGGTGVQRQPVPASYSGPHAEVHNNFSPGDMANLQYSPRDPVFYAHHGNIDRLWSSWSAIEGHEDPDFGDARVYFYDETRTWRYILLNDLKSTERLGYRYSSLMKLDSDEKMTLKTLPRARNRVAFGAAMVESIEDDAPEFLVLEGIRHLETLPHDAVRFGVFAGAPEMGTGMDDPTFLGRFAHVRSEGHDHGIGPLSAVFEVTDVLGRMAKSGEVELFVAALAEDGKTNSEPIPLVADDVHLIE